MIRSDGSGQPVEIYSGAGIPYSFTRDGKQIAFTRMGAETSSDIWIAPMEGTPDQPKVGRPAVFQNSAFTETMPAFSPDGKWLAYASLESGAFQVYVRPFPSGGGRWQVSAANGSRPMWSPDGRELFYLAQDGRIMVISYQSNGGSFIPSKPRVWAETRVFTGSNLRTVSIAPDNRFAALIAPWTSDDRTNHVVFVLNFFDELRRRVGR
jgi:serine/threonine-protein kinase